MSHKFFSWIVLASFLLSACSTATDDVSRLAADYPVIYVSVFTHAEQTNSYTPDFSKDEDAFWEQRQQVVDLAQMLYEKGVGYDYQSDWNFLLAATKFDQGTEETNGKNFLQYLYEDLGASIDPHNHSAQSEYNLADVAYLIEELGVEPSGVVGGFLASPSSDSQLENLWEPVQGGVYDYTWTPEILWGGGTVSHQGEEASFWTSGIWRPQDNEHFSTNDDSAPVAVVGHYHSTWESLDLLLEKQAAGELENGHVYTISIDAHQKLLTPEFIQEFSDKIDSYQAYTDEGQIQWVTIPEVYNIWVEQGSVPTVLIYDGPDTVSSNTCGDGVCSLFERKKNLCSEDC